MQGQFWKNFRGRIPGGRPMAYRRGQPDLLLADIVAFEKKNRPDILSGLLKILVGPPGFEPRTQGL